MKWYWNKRNKITLNGNKCSVFHYSIWLVYIILCLAVWIYFLFIINAVEKLRYVFAHLSTEYIKINIWYLTWRSNSRFHLGPIPQSHWKIKSLLDPLTEKNAYRVEYERKQVLEFKSNFGMKEWNLNEIFIHQISLFIYYNFFLLKLYT